MDFPLVSVLIACYNAERWVAATVESVLAQTWPNIELIVVDDGSIDGSLEVLNSLKTDNMTVVSQKNAGQGAALNLALRYVRGDYIQFLDADDLLGKEKIELQMNRLSTHSGSVAISEWARFYDDESEATFEPEGTWKDLSPVDWLVEDWKIGGGMMYPAMWLIPRSILELAGPWREDLTLMIDTEFFTRVVLNSTGVLFCEGAKTFYRSGLTGSQSGLKSYSGWKSQFTVIELCVARLLSFEDTSRTRLVSSMLWQRFAHASYPYARDLANQGLGRARDLHPSRLTPDGGKLFKFVAAILGWKFARRLQVWSGRP